MAKKRSKRRSNNEGTIFQRANGQWVASLSVKNLDGSTSRRSRNAKSCEHARILLGELKEKHRHGPAVSGKLTVEDLTEKWVRSQKGEKSTIDNRSRAIEIRIRPFIGKLQCDEVTVDVIERWIDAIQSTGENRSYNKTARRNGTPLKFDQRLGLRSQQVAFDVLSAIFAYGARRKLVAFNPCEPEMRPRPASPEINPFTEDECGKILATVKGHRLEALHHLAFSIGPRQGEIFGLQWRDVDWANSTVRIERQARDYAGHVTIKTPKTKGSRRTVSLPETVMEKLHRRRKLAIKEQRAAPDDFVFTSTGGHVIRRTNFGRRLWKSLLKRAGIKHRGHHHVRHTAATTMLREGTPIHIVAHILGHSDSATTHRTYSHYVPSDGKIAADKMQSVLSRMTS